MKKGKKSIGRSSRKAKKIRKPLIKTLHKNGIFKGGIGRGTEKSKSIYEYKGILYTIDNVKYTVKRWDVEDDL